MEPSARLRAGFVKYALPPTMSQMLKSRNTQCEDFKPALPQQQDIDWSAPLRTYYRSDLVRGPDMQQQAVIGLIGGMSWESSAEYYRIINREVRKRLGGAHSARNLMFSVDFGEIEQLQHREDWDKLTEMMKDAAIRLERGGADFVLICTNTMHRMADAVAEVINIPLLHIADPTGEKIKAAGFDKIGLLGTAFTMEQEFYKGRLQDKFDLDVLVPEPDDRRIIHNVIYRELVAGKIQPDSRVAYRQIISRLVGQGAQAIVLGCTELMLLVSQEDSSVPLFDTTTIHALAAVDRALATVGDRLPRELADDPVRGAPHL